MIKYLMLALAGCAAVASVAHAAPKPLVPPPPAPPPASDYRAVDPNDMLVIDTNKGRIIVELSPALAPTHVERIRVLAHRHFYDGQTFFRVVDNFMDQTGDPTNKGTGDSDLPNLKGEFGLRRDASTPFVVASKPQGGELGFIGAMPVASQSEALMPMTADGKVAAWGLFCPGVAGMARAGDPDSANSQFFLMRASYPSLDRKYTPWGRVLIGEDVVRSIKVGEPVAAPQDAMTTVRLGADLPPKDRPKLYVLDSKSASFRALVDARRAERGADFYPCDVDIPAQVR